MHATASGMNLRTLRRFEIREAIPGLAGIGLWVAIINFKFHILSRRSHKSSRHSAKQCCKPLNADDLHASMP
jgi:hypothetical protein